MSVVIFFFYFDPSVKGTGGGNQHYSYMRDLCREYTIITVSLLLASPHWGAVLEYLALPIEMLLYIMGACLRVFAIRWLQIRVVI